MKISYNWLKEFVNLDVRPEEIDRVLTDLGIEVEKIYDNKAKFDKFYVGKVEKSEEVEGSDHLHYCEVTIGTEEIHKVICGAPNVAVGQKVVLGTAGAVVPALGFTLEKRKIRGVESNGMICSKFELGIEEDHSGIWVLPEDAQLGMPLGDYLQENDIIFEISITPNRGDCLSHLGIARELAAEILIDEDSEKIEDQIKITIQDNEKNPRYIARLIKNVKIDESPDWLKKRLNEVGLRPINNVVDVTNLVLMEVNQPLHAFDYDKIAGKEIIIRTANEGEKFTTLDSKVRTLDSEMLMICDAENPIAVAGVMGGENSEITDSTKNVLLESAFFAPKSVRRTAKKLGIQSEASYRFERGVDIDNVVYAANRAAQLIAELGGGTVVSGIIDEYPNKISKQKILVKIDTINKVIGHSFSIEEAGDLLKRLYFEVEIQKDTLEVIPPSFRNDIETEIDVIEEVAILFGYDNIVPEFVSQIDSNSAPIPAKLASPKLRNRVKNFFINKGFNEILTQNMIEPSMANKFAESLVQIANPLGEELSILRPNMIPSVLKTVANNTRVGNNSLRLFEIGKVFNTVNHNDTFVEGIYESEVLIITFYGNANSKQWAVSNREFDFYDLKGTVQEFIEFLKIDKFKFVKSEENIPGFSPNKLQLKINKQVFGYFGEVTKELTKMYDIDKSLFIAIIDFEKLKQLIIAEPKYNKISQFPPALRDVAFVMDETVQAGEILSELKNLGGNFLTELNLFDLYQGKQLGEGKKSLAFNLKFSSDTKTLTDEEIEPIINKMIERIENKFNAQVRKF